MTNQRLEDYLATVERNLAGIPKEERDAAIQEMRSHLLEETADLRRQDPEMGETEATERALRSFGDPGEIGVSYGTGGPSAVVNKRTGEVLLNAVRATGRVARATGVGIGRTIKWLLFFVFAVVFLALGSALTLLIVFQDDIREAAPRPIHSYARELDAETGNGTSSFVVNSDVKEIRVHLDVDRSGATGCAAIVIRDPSGDVAFDSTNECDDLRVMLTFYEVGQWRIEYDYAMFDGHVEVNVYAFERAD